MQISNVALQTRVTCHFDNFKRIIKYWPYYFYFMMITINFSYFWRPNAPWQAFYPSNSNTTNHNQPRMPLNVSTMIHWVIPLSNTSSQSPTIGCTFYAAQTTMIFLPTPNYRFYILCCTNDHDISTYSHRPAGNMNKIDVVPLLVEIH